jgi:uracil-DNA glycosylase
VDKEAALAKVVADIASCDSCTALCRAATNPVPGEGDSNAEIMFVGEAPGQQEDLQGKPFVGAAGRFLNEMLEGIGLKREDVFITNIVKYRPPGNRDPLPEEITECLPFLLRQIEIIKPKLVVFLGRHAMGVFLPGLRISEAHGQPKRKNGQVYLPLYHPAAALYNGSMRQTLIEDFQRIPEILKLIRDEKSESK